MLITYEQSEFITYEWSEQASFLFITYKRSELIIYKKEQAERFDISREIVLSGCSLLITYERSELIYYGHTLLKQWSRLWYLVLN